MDDLTTELDLDAIRVFLHLLGVCGWVGGQLVMGALVPVLRKVSPEAPRLAAARFGRIAWACFALAVVTGVWGLAAVEVADRSGGNRRRGRPDGPRRAPRRRHPGRLTAPAGPTEPVDQRFSNILWTACA